MFIPSQIRRHTPVGTAAYLRCYPYDQWGMTHHQHALKAYARHLDLPAPVLYFDNGRRAHRPEYERLLRAVAAGRHRIVLIPGPWVLDLHDAPAQARLQQLTDHSCHIIELPRPPWRGE
ncbi:hypothetical protein [Streptomyces sp. NBC_00829]|uniref:hypothetical protein n=1 Tax=Streptomyces sp. NBC_00829 TaxID=2903679 RepID=UPI00386A0B7A|nr:recombinase family protein [Streptomyces sp. NBC_00829]